MEEVVETIAEHQNADEPRFDTELFEDPVEIIDEAGQSKKFNCTASISIDYSVKEIS